VIVADTNLLGYLLLGGPEASLADRVFRRDPEWAAPVLWRSELRSILAGFMRVRRLATSDAVGVHAEAERLLAGREYAVRASSVLELVVSSPCTAYDCEYVALAQQLSVPLVTWDKEVLHAFPRVAISPSAFVGGRA
jgi:predicted nucleic acid-binding protein